MVEEEKGLIVRMKTLTVAELRAMLARYGDDVPVMVSVDVGIAGDDDDAMRRAFGRVLEVQELVSAVPAVMLLCRGWLNEDAALLQKLMSVLDVLLEMPSDRYTSVDDREAWESRLLEAEREGREVLRRYRALLDGDATVLEEGDQA